MWERIKNLTLTGKITLAVLSVVVLVMAVTAFTTLSAFRAQLLASIERDQQNLLAAIAGDIENEIQEAHHQLMAAAEATPLQAVRDVEVAQRFLDSKAGLLHIFDNHIGLFTPEGIEITESPLDLKRRGRDYSHRQYITGTVAMQKPLITDPYRSSQAHGHPAVVLTAPIFDANRRMIAILIGSIDLLQENVLGRLTRIKVGRTGYLYLTTADRTVIMHPRKERILAKVEPGQNPLYDRVISERFEGTDRTVNYWGIKLLTTYRRLKVNDWIIASNYPIEEVYAPVRRLEAVFFLTTVAALVSIVLMLFFLIRHFTAPLAALTRHVADLPGKKGDARMVARAGHDEVGTLARAFNTMIRELDEQQAALQEHQELFSLVMQHTPVYTFIKSVGSEVSRVIQVSDNFEQMIGIPAKEMQGKTMQELFPPELAASMTADDIRIVEQGTVLQVDEDLKGRSYTTIKFPIRRSTGGNLLAGFTIDITERKQTERRLKESEERFRELAEALPQTVYETDARGTFQYINRTGLDLFGFGWDEAIGRLNILDMLVPEDRERGRGNMDARFRGDLGQQEYTAVKKDGTTFPVLIHALPIRGDGRPAGLRGILIDISDRKRSESEMLRLQKLESLGVLAGGIAHDFNNILTGILGNLSLAKMQMRQDDPLYQRIIETEKASLHARDLTHQLLTFARGGSPVKKTVRLEPLARNAAGFAARGGNVRIDLQFPPDLRPIEADEGQIAQVFNNLVINACQAMPDGGAVTISAQNGHLGAAVPGGLPAGDYVVVQVADQGIGIPTEHLQKIFDPYFTTKQKGSGLGLAVAYSVMRNHGGHIAAASTLGKGTTFALYFPAARSAAGVDVEPEVTVRTGRGRVLVMDDEEIVRRVVQAILGDLGYDVEFANDGAAAVAAYRRAKEAGSGFDIVILDLTVPGGMGGKETVKELRKIDPAVKAVVSSGYSNDPVMARYRDHGFAGVVKKPFQVHELSTVLSSVLGRLDGHGLGGE